MKAAPALPQRNNAEKKVNSEFHQSRTQSQHFQVARQIGMAVNHVSRKRLFLNQMNVKVRCSKFECQKDINWNELCKIQLQDLWLGIEGDLQSVLRMTRITLFAQFSVNNSSSEQDDVKLASTRISGQACREDRGPWPFLMNKIMYYTLS